MEGSAFDVSHELVTGCRTWIRTLDISFTLSRRCRWDGKSKLTRKRFVFAKTRTRKKNGWQSSSRWMEFTVGFVLSLQSSSFSRELLFFEQLVPRKRKIAKYQIVELSQKRNLSLEQNLLKNSSHDFEQKKIVVCLLPPLRCFFPFSTEFFDFFCCRH